MPTVSSLLRSAQTRARRLQEIRDSAIAYEWQLSAKGYEDFQDYTGYLGKRLRSSTDPGEQLSYQKAIDSARSGYISNEIQRQSIDVIEGRASNTDKYNKVLDLYYSARDHGQFDLASSLHLQLDRLSVTIQNEMETAARAGARAGKADTNYINQYKEASKSYQGAIETLIETYSGSKASDFQNYLDEYAKSLKLPAGTDLFGVVSHLASSATAILEEGFKNAPNTETRIRLENAYNTLANKEGVVKLPTASGGNIALSYKELASNIGLAQYGQYPLTSTLTSRFNPETGQVETVNTFTQQPKTGFTYGRDEEGNPVLIPTYGPNQDTFGSGINATVGGKKSENIDYEVLLKNAGFDVRKQDGSLIIVPTTGSPVGLGSVPGQPVQAFVGPNGELQFIGGDGKLYNFNFDKTTGQFLNVRESQPNPIIGFNDRSALPYTSTIGPDQRVGGAFAILGKEAGAGPGLAPTTFLQSNFGLPAPRMPQLQAPSSKPLQAPNYNVLNAPSNAKISIAKAPPLPKITIAKPKPLPKISVAKPKPLPKLKVNTAVDNRQIRF